MIYCEVGRQYKGELQHGSLSNKDAAENFYNRPALITNSGTTALNLILNSLGLNITDDIFVTTTFGTHYVSSCVTSAIFNYCKPSKTWGTNTKAVIVVHEFGVPHAAIFDIKKKAEAKKIAVIEDCAHSLSTNINKNLIGTIGDYAVFSPRKHILLPNSGILLGDIGGINYQPSVEAGAFLMSVENTLEPELTRLSFYQSKRAENFSRLSKIATEAGFLPYFCLREAVSPYVFPFVVPNSDIQDKIIDQLGRVGIESFRWRGGNIIIVPVHQLLDEYYFTLFEEVVCRKNKQS